MHQPVVFDKLYASRTCEPRQSRQPFAEELINPTQQESLRSERNPVKSTHTSGAMSKVGNQAGMNMNAKL